MKLAPKVTLSILALIILGAIAIMIFITSLNRILSYEDKSRINIYFSNAEIEQSIETKQWTNAGRDGSDFIYIKYKSKNEFETLIEKWKTNPTFTHSINLMPQDFTYGNLGEPDWWNPDRLMKPEILYNGYSSESERFPLKTQKHSLEVMYFSQETLEVYYANISF